MEKKEKSGYQTPYLVYCACVADPPPAERSVYYLSAVDQSPPDVVRCGVIRTLCRDCECTPRDATAVGGEQWRP